MESELKKKIERIEALVNVKKFLAGEKNSPRAIRAYYRINGAAYRRFHSDRGFMHFRVSKGDKIEENDVFYQPDTIGRYIHDGSSVLELGPGQGANLCYLASKYPGASFTGVDLKPPKRKKSTPENLRYIRHDYGDLSGLADNSFDVAFGIETIVHCSDKERVFREVFRVLKPGGIFIVYDYSTKSDYSSYLPYEQTAIDLISKCGACARIESDDDWKRHFAACGFAPVSVTDLGASILPDLRRLMRIASRIMDHKAHVRLLFTLFPSLFTGNVLIGWLGYDCYREGFAYYNEWIYKKAEKQRN